MDPTANLEEQLRLAREILILADTPQSHRIEVYLKANLMAEKAIRLAELTEALDGWIQGGGFLPRQWAKGREIDTRPVCSKCQENVSHTYFGVCEPCGGKPGSQHTPPRRNG